MSILTRHVVIQVLRYFVMTIFATMLLLTVGGAAKEGIRQGYPVMLVLKTVPFTIPEMLRFAIPGSVLFAVCIVFGRMARENEITAIKSAGISPFSVVFPVLLSAYAMGVVTYCLYDVCAVWARPNLRSLVEMSADDIAYEFLRANGSFSANGLSILVRDVDGKSLLQPQITVQSDDGRPRADLVAEAATVRMHEVGKLRFECRNGYLEVEGMGSLYFPDTFIHDVAIGPPRSGDEDHLSPAALGSPAVRRQIKKEQQVVHRLNTMIASGIGNQDRDQLTQQVEQHRSRLFRLRAEIPRRMANGFGCVCFALIGIPVAMWGRSSDTYSTFFVCFLPILLVYYPLLVVGEALACDGVFPYLSVWLADVVLVLIGVILLRRQIQR